MFDFGGGTLDTTLLTIEKGNFEVLSTNGNTHLGGEDFDNRLVAHALKEFKDKTGVDASKSAKCMRRLKTEAEKCKKELSNAEEYEMEIESFTKDEDLELTVTREKFVEVCKDLVEKCKPCIA